MDKRVNYKKEDEFILGLDIGIGSVGYAVINASKKRIELANSVIFTSGEEGATKSADRASQKARGYRSSKRLNRRKKQRRTDIFKLLDEISFYKNGTQRKLPNNLIELRAKGLDEKLTNEQIVAVILYFINHRGYKDFYEDSSITANQEENIKLSKQMENAKSKIEEMFSNSSYRTIGEMIFKDSHFKNDGQIKYRNTAIKVNSKKETKYSYLISRERNIDELRKILINQAEYYDMLSIDVIENIIFRIFTQRDFEDGPGPNKNSKNYTNYLKNSSHRIYTGFDDTIGHCLYYPNENKFTKNSIVYDEFVLINILSQYKFADSKTGEIITLNKDNYNNILYKIILNDCKITLAEIQKYLKTQNIEIVNKINKKAILKLPYIQFLIDENNFRKEEILLFKEEIKNYDYFDSKSLSNQIGMELSKSITPSRRKEKLKDILHHEATKSCVEHKNEGMANTSLKYMSEAIYAFCEGIPYGKFQSSFKTENHFQSEKLIYNGKLLPINDPDVMRNPVVYRSLMQTRKVINNVITDYNIIKVNIEVAREVSASFEQRKKIEKNQADNLKNNQELERDLQNDLYANGYEKYTINSSLIQKYRLWKEQKERDIYTNAPIAFSSLLNRSGELQVDHIIPQSIVLDDTLNNKVLTYSHINAQKGNRLPIQCLNELSHNDYSLTEKEYKENVKKLKVSKKKEKYLLLEELNDDIINIFVSRNINDTRYICRYIVNYLKVAFAGKIEINAIKGSLTNTYRKKWLTQYDYEKGIIPSVYALEDKGRDLHYYHHAVDAIIIANLDRKYIVLGSIIESIRSVRSDKTIESNKKSEEIDRLINNAVKTMKHYGFNEEYTKQLIRKDSLPSVCKNLYREVEVRIPLKFNFKDINSKYLYAYADKNKYKRLNYLYFEIKNQISNNEIIKNDLLKEFNEICELLNVPYEVRNNKFQNIGKDTEKSETIDLKKFKPKLADYLSDIQMISKEEYKQVCKEYYVDEELEFINNIDIQYIQFVKERKFRGNVVSSDVAKSLDEALKETNKDLKKKGLSEINNIYQLEEYLNDPMTIKPNPSYFIKWNDKEHLNYTIYMTRSYYCTEVYEDNIGETHLRGIRFLDLYKSKGKLILKKPLPKNFKHICYLFKNDYIEILDRNKNTKKDGFGAYRGVEYLTVDRLKIRTYSNKKIINQNKPKDRYCSVKSIQDVIKLEQDKFGHIIGKEKCGDQSLFITKND